MNKTKAILFDLDGTLINSEFLHFSCWNDILIPFNVELNFNLYLDEYAGISLFNNAQRLNGEFELGCSITALMFQKENLYLEKLEKSKMELMPYALEALQYFHEIKLPMGLVTSSSRKEVEIIVENNNLQKYFSAIITRDDVNNYKPHPEPYQSAAKLLRYFNNEYIVFEDSFAGVSSAIGANLTCFFIKNQFAKECDFKALKFWSFDNLQLATQYLIDNKLLTENARN